MVNINIDGKWKILLGIGATIGLKYAIAAMMNHRREQRFELVGTVKELVCYPVKSCKGIYVQEAECTKLGLKTKGVTDRHWMVTRSNGRFMSQRQEPKMAHIAVTIADDYIEMTAPGMQTLKLPKQMTKTASNVNDISVWNCNFNGIDCGDEAAKWISDFLQQEDLRVVFYSQDLPERRFGRSPKSWMTRVTDNDKSAFADWGCYLFLTTSSLEALNKHMDAPLSMRTFRPNIIIDGTDAFDEDVWEEILIGEDVRMRCLDGCDRCVMTTVNPDTGVRRDDGEPLKTLKRIRSFPPYDKYDAAVFGVNVAPDVCGTIQVGDPVYAIRGQRITDK